MKTPAEARPSGWLRTWRVLTGPVCAALTLFCLLHAANLLGPSGYDALLRNAITGVIILQYGFLSLRLRKLERECVRWRVLSPDEANRARAVMEGVPLPEPSATGRDA